MTVWNNIEDILSKIEKYIITMSIFILISGSLFKFIARNFLSSPNAIEISDFFSGFLPHLVLLTGFLGASAGLTRREVIKIDLLKIFIKEKKTTVINMITHVFTFSLVVFFIFLAVKSLEFGDTLWITFGYIPVFILISVKVFLALVNK
jgi:TRAP-type C4-dicarboxylate transport system permease small subunit